MLQKRTFKVLAAIPKRDGGHFWMRCGNGYTNKDDSINVYLDAIPRDMKFQLRELDEEDLRKREAYRSPQPGGEAAGPGDAYRSTYTSGEASGPGDAPPF